MKWTIAYDAGCDRRNPQPAEPCDLHEIPLKILLGEQEVLDDGSCTMEDLQALLDGSRCKTGTACPSVGDWQQVMEAGEQVIAITISGAVSGSFQSACIARSMVLEEHPEKKIFVFDSISGSGVMEFMVRRTLKLIREGSSFEEVCADLESCRGDYQVFFLLQNVDNLMSNGRLNPIIGRAVKALKLCLLATVSPQGTLQVLSKTRGFEKVMDLVALECEKREFVPRKLLISHCMNPSGAETLRDKLLARFPGVRTEIIPIGPLCGYYAEKGGLIVALEK